MLHISNINPDRINQPLYVVTPIFNAQRYRSRWANYHAFEKHITDSGAILYTVEAAFGERDFAIGQEPVKNSHHIKVRTNSEVWLKENLINIAFSHLPSDWKYAMWADSDIQFSRTDWVRETIHKLQHYPIIQPFSEAIDLDSNHNSLLKHKSFTYCYINNVTPKLEESQYYYYGKNKKNIILWHPGYAWAIRRDAFNALGGLIDFAPLGAADNHMAHALIGKASSSFHPDITGNYRDWVMEWQNRANIYIRKNIGYLDGLILHSWHGNKKNRKYKERWKILVDHGFDPLLDLKKDWQGVWQLTQRSIGLRDDIRKYFSERNEDEHTI